MLTNGPKMDWRGRAVCRISSAEALHVEDQWEAHLCMPRASCALVVVLTWWPLAIESRQFDVDGAELLFGLVGSVVNLSFTLK
jgi:hypothetical protein